VVRRLRGGVKLAGVAGGAAAAFWGMGARSKRKGERNGLLGLLWCSCARERRLWGAAASPPRRWRGGDCEAVLGGVAKGGGTSARPRAVEKEQRDAWALA